MRHDGSGCEMGRVLASSSFRGRSFRRGGSDDAGGPTNFRRCGRWGRPHSAGRRTRLFTQGLDAVLPHLLLPSTKTTMMTVSQLLNRTIHPPLVQRAFCGSKGRDHVEEHFFRRCGQPRRVWGGRHGRSLGYTCVWPGTKSCEWALKPRPTTALACARDHSLPSPVDYRSAVRRFSAAPMDCGGQSRPDHAINQSLIDGVRPRAFQVLNNLNIHVTTPSRYSNDGQKQKPVETIGFNFVVHHVTFKYNYKHTTYRGQRAFR